MGYLWASFLKQNLTMCTCSFLTGELTSVSTVADILDKGSGAVLLIDGKIVYGFWWRCNYIY